MDKQNKILRNLLFVVILSFIIAALIVDGGTSAIVGFVKLQFLPARLINDFIETSSIGSALINSALVGLVGMLLVMKLKVQLSGPTFAAVLTLMGFGLFGKTVLNITPILLGVFISSKFIGKEFKEYIIIALFGTALGPLVSFIAFEFGLTGLAAVGMGLGLGLITGFLLPAIAVSMLHLHQGYNLYNMGLTCGFLGIFTAAFIFATGHSLEGTVQWFDQEHTFLMFLVPALSLIFIITGLVLGGKNAIKSFVSIQKIPGRLPSDFMFIQSIEGALINSGLLGLLGCIYIIIVKGDFNGPVIGGLLTVMGFAAFGTNLKNSWPVVLGVILCGLIFRIDLNAPGPILAAIFVTTLAPLAGEFGIITGIIAGFIHLLIVQQTGAWYGGINLYNNGFAGGLTATIIVAVIQWYRTNKTEFNKGFRR